MLKILIGDVTEHKRDALIWSIIATCTITILAGNFIIPLIKNDESNLKYFAIFLALLNTYVSTIVTRITANIFDYCRKKDRDELIADEAQKNSRAIQQLIKEKEVEPLKKFKKRYGAE